MKFKKIGLGILFLSALSLTSLSPIYRITKAHAQYDLSYESRRKKEEERIRYLWNEKFKDYKEGLFFPFMGQELYFYKETKYSNYYLLWSTPQFIISGNRKSMYPPITITPVLDDRKIDMTAKLTLKEILFDENFFTSMVRNPKLVIRPLFPDIFNPFVEIREISIENRDIPLSYLKHLKNDSILNYTFEQFSLNLKELFNDSLLKKEDFDDSKLEILIKAEATLESYDKVNVSEVGDVDDLKRYGEFERFTSENYSAMSTRLRYPVNHPKIKNIVSKLKGNERNALKIARNIYDFVIDTITYHDKELHLSILELLEKKIGDCDDYSSLFITLMRSAGIPAKESSYRAGSRMGGVSCMARFPGPF